MTTPLLEQGLRIQAFNLCALPESESFSSTSPVLITGPQGFECLVLFIADSDATD